MPGQKENTVGYLVDEGKILGPLEPVNLAGKEYEGKQEVNVVVNHKYLYTLIKKYKYY